MKLFSKNYYRICGDGLNPFLVQNPDTGAMDEFKNEERMEYVHQLGTYIMEKYQLHKPPIFYTIYKDDPENNKYLEEDDLLLDVISSKLDDRIPIWWQSSEINPERIYQLRVDRYERTGYDIKQLGRKKTFIAGIGLLGAELAMDCAILGIREQTLLDYGNVDWFNIYRQPLYSVESVFKSKVDAARERLEAMGGVKINTLKMVIPSLITLPEEKNEAKKVIATLDEEISKVDVVITALDTFSARMVIQTIALARKKLLINTAAGLVGGTIQIVRDLTVDPCLACGIFHDRSQDGGACTLASFGTPKIIAGFVMDTLIDLLFNKDVSFNYFKYDHFTKNINKDKFGKAKDCEFCGKGGIIAEYEKNNADGLISWLYDSF
ncbi:MAG: ThiF family adenylyltransferase [Candidatus Helarchaeota archaeon]